MKLVKDNVITSSIDSRAGIPFKLNGSLPLLVKRQDTSTDPRGRMQRSKDRLKVIWTERRLKHEMIQRRSCAGQAKVIGVLGATACAPGVSAERELGDGTVALESRYAAQMSSERHEPEPWPGRTDVCNYRSSRFHEMSECAGEEGAA